MSKSFNWCIKRLKNPKISNWSDRKWEDAKEIDVKQFLPPVINKTNHWIIEGTKTDGSPIKLMVILEINPDLDEYDYYTSNASIHDGTLLFETEQCQKAVSKILCASTYNKAKQSPQDLHTIRYTIGNLILLNEFDGDWISSNKPWMRQRTSVALPIIYKQTYDTGTQDMFLANNIRKGELYNTIVPEDESKEDTINGL